MFTISFPLEDRLLVEGQFRLYRCTRLCKLLCLFYNAISPRSICMHKYIYMHGLSCTQAWACQHLPLYIQYTNNKHHNQNSHAHTHSVFYLHLTSEHNTHTMNSTYGPDMGRLTRRATATGPRMLGWCQVWFWCRSITSTISECVALWKTSRWLRWNVLICFWDLNPTLLDMIVIIQHSSHTQPFIRDEYQRQRGEKAFWGWQTM